MAANRLTGLDSSFLYLEDETHHMHVASVMLFKDEPPAYDDLVEGIEARLHLVPRYRQRLAFVPLAQGRPRWVDDPHLNLHYHVRHTSLPEPGSEEQLRQLAGRVFSQPLDRDKPLWEIWLVEGLEGDRFALLSKTHHALVDGIAGVDLLTVLFDTQPEPVVPPDRGPRWLPRPMPGRSQLLAEALVERATVPMEVGRSVRALARRPRKIAVAAGRQLVGLGALAWAGLAPAPPSPYNTPIGPHRRFAFVRASLADVKAMKDELDGTVNDVVLTIVTGALGRHMRRRGLDTTDTELRAMVPVSVRGDDGRGETGNQVAAVMAPLPVWAEDPVACFEVLHEAMQAVKQGGQALGAKALTDLTGFAPPTIMSTASRVVVSQRWFNVVVTNVPGPQMPLYLQGRELQDLFPMVPLAQNQALGVAIMSYHGRLNFGLLGDYDALHDLEDLATDFEDAIVALAEATGVELTPVKVGSGRGARNGGPPAPRRLTRA